MLYEVITDHLKRRGEVDGDHLVPLNAGILRHVAHVDADAPRS